MDDKTPLITNDSSTLIPTIISQHPANQSGNRALLPPQPIIQSDDVIMMPRPSILLPHLQTNEKHFFRLIHSGDVNAVRKFLEHHKNFNINCKNFQGVTGLHVAIQTRSETMVEYLLSHNNIQIGDCVLHAIRDNQPKIMEMLLDKQKKQSWSSEFQGTLHSSDFPDYMTPLILAAQCGHYEIIEMLIARGHAIAKPHSPACRCRDCRQKIDATTGEDLLHAENLRLNLYRAVANPAYICHSTHDPILISFQLSVELRDCARLVPEFRTVYNELAEEVSMFAVNLVGCCRNADEIEQLLRIKSGMHGCSFIYPRLMLAMDMKQKTFVAHPNVQHIVESAWRANWYDYNLKPVLAKICYPIYRLCMLPLIVLMLLALPNHPQVTHWQIPLNRMINHSASFIVFLILIFLESNLDKTHQKRKPPDSGLEPLIILFVIGNIWNILRMCMIQGFNRYFRYLWNWHAIITNLFYILTFLFWLASYLDYKQNDQIDLERKYWHYLDPILISEGTFAVATIMTYFRLMFFCRLNYYLGPLQISLGKMCADMAKYLIIFTIIIVSFTAGLCRFYQYYDGMVKVDDYGIKTAQISSFTDVLSTFRTFFWAVFCMSPLESADVIIQNLPGESENKTIINQHAFTEAIGYFAFALFEVLTVEMILNMLIATMSSTFQRVIDNLDIEWTVGKTDFYMEYMMQSTLPTPLNLIPTSAGIGTFMEWFQIQETDDKESIIDYSTLMSQLVQRYFRERDSSNQDNDLDLFKQELLEIRELVKEIRKNQVEMEVEEEDIGNS